MGHCLCGAVTLRAEGEQTGVQACHCLQCQRWTGGGPLYALPVASVAVEGDASIEAYRHSTWGERAFCRTCGTTLYWKMQDRGITAICPGLLEDQAGLTVTEEIFVDQRPAWLPAYAGAAQSTAAEEQAKLDAYLAGERDDG